jgi:hypothetical protein
MDRDSKKEYSTDLSKMTKPMLIAEIKKRGLKGYSGKNKDGFLQRSRLQRSQLWMFIRKRSIIEIPDFGKLYTTYIIFELLIFIEPSKQTFTCRYFTSVIVNIVTHL